MKKISRPIQFFLLVSITLAVAGCGDVDSVATDDFALIAEKSSKIDSMQKESFRLLEDVLVSSAKVLEDRDMLTEPQVKVLLESWIKVVHVDSGNELAPLIQCLLNCKSVDVRKIFDEVDTAYELRRALDNMGKS